MFFLFAPMSNLPDVPPTPIVEERVDAPSPSSPDDGPWFTGTLLSPLGAVVPVGHFELDNYFFYIDYNGVYNGNWQKEKHASFQTWNPQILFSVGLLEWMDLQITPQVVTNSTGHTSSTGFGDFPVAINFQLLDVDAVKYVPGIKLSVQETFPTGKYDELNDSRLATDAIGSGSYTTTFGLIFYKQYAVDKNRALTMTLSTSYSLAPAFYVKGINLNGGTEETRGYIAPGNAFQAMASFEFSLSQRFVLAFDALWVSQDLTRFFDTAGTGDILDKPSSSQLSFAPALECNFTPQCGLCVGSWLTACGRNTDAFWSTAAFLYYHY